MLQFWEGVPLWHECTKQVIPIRMALLSVMCDIPTTRKHCGFAGHSAAHGCSKCLEKFENKLDYSGYDWDSWEASYVWPGTFVYSDKWAAYHQLATTTGTVHLTDYSFEFIVRSLRIIRLHALHMPSTPRVCAPVRGSTKWSE